VRKRGRFLTFSQVLEGVGADHFSGKGRRGEKVPEFDSCIRELGVGGEKPDGRWAQPGSLARNRGMSGLGGGSPTQYSVGVEGTGSRLCGHGVGKTGDQ